MGEDEAGAVFWTGIISAAGSSVQLVAVPLWGALADRVGRKPMVLRALGVATATLGLLALAGSALQVLVLRVLQGIGAAPNAPLLVLAAALLPAKRMSAGLGMLQTMQYVGVSLGPLIGGLAAAAYGYRGAAVAAAISAGLTTLAVATLVREPPAPTAVHAEKPPSLARQLAAAFAVPRWRATIWALAAYQAAYTVSTLLLPLHVDTTAVRAGADPAPYVGWSLAANALGIAVGSTLFGWVGGRLGAARMGTLALLAAGALSLPQALLDAPWQFLPFRLLLGLAAGGVLPSLRASFAEASSESEDGQLGAVYGLALSAGLAGSVAGAPLGSMIAATWGVPATHLAAGVGLLLTGASFGWGVGWAPPKLAPR